MGRQPKHREKQLTEIRQRREKRRTVTHGGPIINGRECLLKVRISTPPGVDHKNRTVTALVDTGCTMTAIRAELAAALGLPTIRTTKASTASSGKNPVECDVVIAELALESDGRTIKSYRELVVADMEDDLLFGMDALFGGVLTVDLAKGRWTWKVKKFGKPPSSD